MTETWLQDGVSNSELFNENYAVFRKDRNLDIMNVNRGGGVLLGVRRDISANRLNLEVLEELLPNVDVVGCKLIICNVIVFVFVIYMQGKSTPNHYQSLFDFFSTFKPIQSKNVMFIGDLNITSSPVKTILNDFLSLCNLTQFNTFLNCYDNLLDLVIANFECLVSRESVPLVPEDKPHPSVSISFSLEHGSYSTDFPYNACNKNYNFKRANFPLLYQLLSQTNWNFLLNSTDVSLAVSLFYDHLYNIFDQSVPRFKHINTKVTYPCWYTREIIKELKKKEQLHRRYKISKSHLDYNAFSSLRRITKIKIDMAYRTYIHETESALKNNPRQFWKFVRQRRKKSRIPNSMMSGISSFDSPQSIVDAFADFFKSVYIQSSPPILEQKSDTQNITINPLTKKEICDSLNKLKNTSTAGHDKIPSFILRDCSECLTTPLHFIFNLAIRTSTFPEQWKIAKVSPVHKGGTPDNYIENYRPISILSNFSKAFEVCIYNNLFHQIKSLISPAQHGFFTKRSTLTNLTSFLQKAYRAVGNKKQLDVVYTDFGKAFDRLDHGLIASKMFSLGLHLNLVNFFISFLKGRLQFVEYNGFKSSIYGIPSGAPQGSNLAPLIFAIFVNDITVNISSNCLLFADDLKLFRTINSATDCNELQNDIDTLERWCVINKLSLNIKKCKTMSISNLNSEINFDYTLANTILERVDSIRDLGVIVDKKLTFNNHIDEIVNSTLKTLGFIIRSTKEFKNIDSIITLYNSLIKSKLLYAALVWFPSYNIHVDRLEYVQRRFLKYLCFMQDGAYPPRGFDHVLLLQRFNFLSLKQCSILNGQLFLFKLCNNMIDSPEMLNELNFFVPPKNTRKQVRFYLEHKATNLAKCAPLYKACTWFNTLNNLSDIDLFNNSPAQFKKSVKSLISAF